MTYEEFREDAKIVDAVIRNFEIIGEAAGYNPEDIQERFPESAMGPPINLKTSTAIVLRGQRSYWREWG